MILNCNNQRNDDNQLGDYNEYQLDYHEDNKKIRKEKCSTICVIQLWLDYR